tara:strand:+ start:28327 stop:29079 length:753 start_codon:yes stop_codon:yes gene_type:complete
MKVLVPVKRVVDPYATIHVKKDGSGVETQNVKMTMNPFDEIAVEEAIRWKEQQKISEVVVVSIGNVSAQETLRHALALGADQAIHINTEETLEPLNIAKLLKWVAEQERPDILIMGKQAIDNDCNQVGQMLSTLLEWPQATFASEIIFEENSMLHVTREVDGGLETLSVSMPAVLTTDLRLNEPRYPALPNIMKAKRKPLKSINVEETGLTLKTHQTILKVEPPKQRAAGILVESVSELMNCLLNKEKVI